MAILRKPVQRAIFCTAAIVISVFAGTAVRASSRAVNRPLLAGAQVPERVLSTVQHACQDCHSPNTRWPWYSQLPPLSWAVHRDVARARQFMDLSKWDQYTDAERRGYLVSIEAAVRAHLMPPSRYVIMHPKAKLSDGELRALEDWASAEQQRLRAARASEIGE